MELAARVCQTDSMHLVFNRAVLAASAFLGASAALSDEAPSRPQDVTRFHSAIHQADQRRDFGGAVRSAEECLDFVETIHARTGQRPGFGYCAYYLSSALRSGRGTSRDAVRAFQLLAAVAATDDGKAALDLAEMYLNGEGTPRNAVEAAVLVWRVEHGAASIYSDYWGMCDVCEDNSAQERSLDRRLAHELTLNEQREAAAIERSRFADIVERVKQRDTQIETATASLFAAIAALFWLRRRSKRQRLSHPT